MEMGSEMDKNEEVSDGMNEQEKRRQRALSRAPMPYCKRREEDLSVERMI